MKILLVEDNLSLADRIKQHLVDKHYIVDSVSSGEEALERVKHINYATIILDLGLPNMSGDDVCKSIRHAGVESPILILTGTDIVDIKVKLLNLGADDYVTKPFDSEELRARVAALARRQPTARQKPQLKFGDLIIDIEQRKVYRQGIEIDLRRKEFDILTYLVHHNGRVLTREMILNHVWNSDKNGLANTVDVHIKYLRDKIDRPFGSHFIKTEYGLGYKVDIPK